MSDSEVRREVLSTRVKSSHARLMAIEAKTETEKSCVR